jgi:hypothetical protein
MILQARLRQWKGLVKAKKGAGMLLGPTLSAACLFAQDNVPGFSALVWVNTRHAGSDEFSAAYCAAVFDPSERGTGLGLEKWHDGTRSGFGQLVECKLRRIFLHATGYAESAGWTSGHRTSRAASKSNAGTKRRRTAISAKLRALKHRLRSDFAAAG